MFKVITQIMFYNPKNGECSIFKDILQTLQAIPDQIKYELKTKGTESDLKITALTDIDIIFGEKENRLKNGDTVEISCSRDQDNGVVWMLEKINGIRM